jgi:hypothetical protein
MKDFITVHSYNGVQQIVNITSIALVKDVNSNAVLILKEVDSSGINYEITDCISGIETYKKLLVGDNTKFSQ